jgi:hypothetical protein
VLAADFLQTTINSSKSNDLLHLPIPLPYDPDFPILQYADDTLLIFINLSLVLVATYYLPTSPGITCTRLSSLVMVLEMLVGTT